MTKKNKCFLFNLLISLLLSYHPFMKKYNRKMMPWHIFRNLEQSVSDLFLLSLQCAVSIRKMFWVWDQKKKVEQNQIALRHEKREQTTVHRWYFPETLLAFLPAWVLWGTELIIDKQCSSSICLQLSHCCSVTGTFFFLAISTRDFQRDWDPDYCICRRC